MGNLIKSIIRDLGGHTMKAQMQLALLKMDDPRIIRAVVIGLALVLTVVAQAVPGGAEAVYACPASGGGGCVGG
jgi:hypothetical protein